MTNKTTIVIHVFIKFYTTLFLLNIVVIISFKFKIDPDPNIFAINYIKTIIWLYWLSWPIQHALALEVALIANQNRLSTCHPRPVAPAHSRTRTFLLSSNKVRFLGQLVLLLFRMSG